MPVDGEYIAGIIFTMQLTSKIVPKHRAIICFVIPAICFLLSCERKEIDFGTVPENTYTHLIFIDTVGVSMSTLLIDSFSTGNASSFLVGKYKDPYLGLVTAQPFCQLNKPASVPAISDQAVFDSLSLIVRFNKYYYGDTSKTETINVNELDQPITLSYNNLMYNTSRVAVKPTPLGSKAISLRPSVDDSLFIRLNDVKGQELFAKLRAGSDEMNSTETFQYYFKGISLTTGDADTSVVYGIKDTIFMRVNYHVNNPFPESRSVDFISQVNTEAFNQIITDRSGTNLLSSGKGVTEIPSSATNHLSFTQPGAGLYLKLGFPGLKGIIASENVIRLLKAELIIRPLRQSFDRYSMKLPSQVFLVNTDGSNIPGFSVTASAGGVLYANPVIDNVFGLDNYYSFDVTSAISSMINTAGSEDDAFFAVQGYAGSTVQLDRIIVGDASTSTPGFTTQLKLSVLQIDK